jgi:nitroreductase
MELGQAMRTTPATREFTDDPVPDEVVYELLERARFATNGGNRQAWHVVIVRDPELRSELGRLWELAQREYVPFRDAGLVPFAASEAYWRNPPGGPSTQPVDLEAARRVPARSTRGASPQLIATAAPVLLLVLADLSKLTAMDSGLRRLSIASGASVYPFVQNVLLAARDAGLGSVLTTILVRQEAAVKELLHIPEEWAMSCVIPLGRPKREITKLRRQPVEEFTTIDYYDGPAFEV